MGSHSKSGHTDGYLVVDYLWLFRMQGVVLLALLGIAAAVPAHYRHSRCKFNGQFLPDLYKDVCQYQRCDYGDEPWYDAHGNIQFTEVDMMCAPGTTTNPHYFNPEHPCEVISDKCHKHPHPFHPVHHNSIHHSPAHYLPVHHAPAHHLPVHHAPAHHLPVHHAPAHPLPVHHAPIHHAPHAPAHPVHPVHHQAPHHAY